MNTTQTKAASTRKVLALLVAIVGALALSFTLVGCGGANNDKNFIGTWKMVSMEDEEIGTITAEDLDSFGLGEITLELVEGGTGTFTLMDEVIDLTWEAKSATEVEIGDSETSPAPFTLENDQLIGEMEGSKIVFEKKAE